MRRRLALLALGLAVLAGCGSGLSTGTVTGKEYKPASSYWTQSCMSYNSNGTCKFSMPVENKTPQRWVLNLRNGEETGYVDVDEETWKRVRVGDEWKGFQ